MIDKKMRRECVIHSMSIPGLPPARGFWIASGS